MGQELDRVAREERKAEERPSCAKREMGSWICLPEEAKFRSQMRMQEQTGKPLWLFGMAALD